MLNGGVEQGQIVHKLKDYGWCHSTGLMKTNLGKVKLAHQTYLTAFIRPRLSTKVKDGILFFTDVKVKLSLFLEPTLNFSSLVF